MERKHKLANRSVMKDMGKLDKMSEADLYELRTAVLDEVEVRERNKRDRSKWDVTSTG